MKAERQFLQMAINLRPHVVDNLFSDFVGQPFCQHHPDALHEIDAQQQERNPVQATDIPLYDYLVNNNPPSNPCWDKIANRHNQHCYE